MHLFNLNLKKLCYLAILTLATIGFCYFEASILLKTLAITFTVILVFFSLINKKEKISTDSEWGILFITFLINLCLYYLLYGSGFPLALVMLAGFCFTFFLSYLYLSWVAPQSFRFAPELRFFSALNGLLILQIFLSLYFWPAAPEIKSIIIVIIFYLLINLIYLYVENVLHLKRAIGILSISIVLLGAVLLSTWLKLSR